MTTPPRPPAADPLRDRLRRYGKQLTPASRKVAEYLDQNRLEVITASALELAAAIGTSDATVVRTVQSLGFEGMQDLRRQLARSHLAGSDIASDMLNSMEEVDDSAPHAMARLLDIAESGLHRLRDAETATAMEAVLAQLHRAPRIAVFGIGPSAWLAGYMAHRLRREGREALLLDRSGIGLGDQLLALRPRDAVLMLAYGEPYREAEVTAATIRAGGGPVTLISDSAQMAAALRADASVILPRGEPDRVAFHGTTLTSIEMLLLGLATSRRAATLASLERLKDLRAALTRQSDRRGKRLPGLGPKDGA